MNGKKARILRKQVGNNFSDTDYTDKLHNKFTPINPVTKTGGKQLFTTSLVRSCNRAKYLALKQLYRLTGD